VKKKQLRNKFSMNDLKPMSSAPNDGREILLQVKARAGMPGKFLVGHWMQGGHCIEDHPPIKEGWYFWNGQMFDKAAEPIAWTDLPEAQPAKYECTLEEYGLTFYEGAYLRHLKTGETGVLRAPRSEKHPMLHVISDSTGAEKNWKPDEVEEI
jgi:hypothetical protein